MRRCKRSSLVSSGLRCKAVAGHGTTNAETCVMPSLAKRVRSFMHGHVGGVVQG